MSAPASEGDRLRLSSEGAKWLIAVVLPLVMAGGYWGFSQNHRLKLEERRTPFRADRPMVEAQPDLPKKSAAEDVRRPIAESVRAEPERRPSAESARAEPERRPPPAALGPSDALRSLGEPILQAAVAAPEPPRPGIGGTPSAISIDGLYAGAICYGPAASEPPRCFRARGTIERGRIAARWSGRGSRVTMFMAGEISPTGDAKIRIDAGQPNGTRAAAIEMSGSLQAGRLDAAGAFRNGRTATLSWSKQDRAR